MSSSVETKPGLSKASFNVADVDKNWFVMNPGKAEKGSEYPFPVKLHFMLADIEKRGLDDIASWLPDGKTFKIHKPKEAAKRILPDWFRHTSYGSFQRQLNLYNFSRIKDGSTKGGYRHELFVKGSPILAYCIRRVAIKNIRQCKDSSSRQEANPTPTSVMSSTRKIRSGSCSFPSHPLFSDREQCHDQPLSWVAGVVGCAGDLSSAQSSATCSSLTNLLPPVVASTLPTRTAPLSVSSKLPCITSSLFSSKDTDKHTSIVGDQTPVQTVKHTTSYYKAKSCSTSMINNRKSTGARVRQFIISEDDDNLLVGASSSSFTRRVTGLLCADLSISANQQEDGDTDVNADKIRFREKRGQEQLLSLSRGLIESFAEPQIQAEIIHTFLD